MLESLHLQKLNHLAAMNLRGRRKTVRGNLRPRRLLQSQKHQPRKKLSRRKPVLRRELHANKNLKKPLPTSKPRPNESQKRNPLRKQNELEIVRVMILRCDFPTFLYIEPFYGPIYLYFYKLFKIKIILSWISSVWDLQ